MAQTEINPRIEFDTYYESHGHAGRRQPKRHRRDFNDMAKVLARRGAEGMAEGSLCALS